MKAKLIFAVALVLIAAFALTGAAAAANSASNNADFMHCVENAGEYGTVGQYPLGYDPLLYMSNSNANAGHYAFSSHIKYYLFNINDLIHYEMGH